MHFYRIYKLCKVRIVKLNDQEERILYCCQRNVVVLGGGGVGVDQLAVVPRGVRVNFVGGRRHNRKTRLDRRYIRG